MLEITKELWNGNVRPKENCRPQTEEYTHLLEYILRHKTDLCSTLTESQLEIFNKFDSCVSEYIELNEESLFAYAYRLGMRTAMEALLERFQIE